MEKDKLKLFLDESYETLNSLDKQLIQLGKNPDHVEYLDTIHANFKTFLDSAKLFGFHKLGSMTHIGERLIDHLRKSEYDLSNEIITIILKLNFSIRDIIFAIDETGKEPQLINSSMVTDIEEIITKQESGEEFIVASSDDEDDGVKKVGDIPIVMTPIFSEDEVMDDLMNTIIPLLHTQTQIKEIASKDKFSPLDTHSRKLELLVRDIYTKVHKAKTKTLGTLLHNFDKVVSDIAQMQDKQVTFVIEGEEKELDTRMLDILRNCLIHIIKNSVEHGIEMPEIRTELGKSAMGEIHLKAFHHGELFYIKIKDDGAGIEPIRVKRKLIEKNLLLTEEAERLTDQEVMDYIFQEGFSSSKSSAGLDIVKSNVEQIAGKFYIFKNIPGKGVEFHITLPLVDEIVPSIVVSVGTERYIITRANLYEIMNLESDTFINTLEVINGFPTYKHRGDLIPIIFLAQILKYEDKKEVVDKQLDAGKKISILILEVNNFKYGLVADIVEDMSDVIVRPLNYEIKNLYLFSGLTILKDESPALILDVGEIMRVHLKNLNLVNVVEEEME
ncbi:MAG: chemotaxis protein CheW [Leptospiraceae bacterium]|nr:chemotaxis protein CheW [Leptospiraceae bacterium]